MHFREIRKGPFAPFAALLLATAFQSPGRALQRSNESLPAHPSVLLITIDTLRADHVGCYGYRGISTPVMDELAREGVRFQKVYTQAPITLPAHTVILTGTYPTFNGVRDFTSHGLASNIPTLAEVMRSNGYRTAAFVSSFALDSMWGLDRGFSLYDDNLRVTTAGSRDLLLVERRGDRTVNRLLEWLNSDGGKPFFVWLHLYDPHSPYQPPEPYRSRYSSHLYDGEIAFDDAQVGRVLERLKAQGLYKRTAVILLSDHGESLGEHGENEHGFFIYDATLRVPLILKLPDEASAGTVISTPVSIVDVAPTVARLCHIPPSQTADFQGRSLLDALRPGPARSEEEVYAESYYPRDSFGWHELRAVVTHDWKFIDAPRAELYDLTKDPGERSNLYQGNSARAAAMRDRLRAIERRFEGAPARSPSTPLDPETLEKLKSLGYVGYKAGATPADVSGAALADPKDKIGTLHRILHAGDLRRLGKYSQADELLGSLEESEPGLYVVPFERGENDLAAGRPEAALEEFSKALARNPSFDQAALGLGRAFFMLGKDDQAATALELALRLNPRNFLARDALAKIYWRQNRLDLAEKELAQAVRTHPDYAEGHADYGIVLAKLQKYSEALGEIRRGVESGFQDAVTYNYLGIAYSQLGQPAQAVEAYRQALELNPRYPTPYLNLALEYRKLGQPAKAREYYKKACQMSEGLCRQFAPVFSKAGEK